MKIKLNKVPAFYINLDREFKRNDDMIDFLSVFFDSYQRIPAFDRDYVKIDKPLDELWISSELAYKHGIAVARSHIKALESITQTPAVVFEDDIEIVKYKNTLRIPDDADVVYLGFMPVSMTEPENSTFMDSKFEECRNDWAKIDKKIGNRDCYRVYGMVCCHAMLYVTDKAVARVLEVFRKSEETSIPIDVLSSEFMKDLNVYVTKTTLFGQKDSPHTHNHAKDFNPKGPVPQVGVGS